MNLSSVAFTDEYLRCDRLNLLKYLLYTLCILSCQSVILVIFRISVRIGEYDLSKEIDYEEDEDYMRTCNSPPQDLDIEEIIPYPGYDPVKLTDDIGLIRVAKMNLTVGKGI